MQTLTETQRARIAKWSEAESAEHAAQLEANVDAEVYRTAIPYPEALPTAEQAREMLRDLVASSRKMSSRFNGDCALTSARFAAGTEIYYNREHKLAMVASAVDEVLAQ